MSCYATVAFLKAVALRDRAFGSDPDDQILPFIVQASTAEIDPYIRSRYLQDGPLVDWADDLRLIAVQIAAVLYLTHRGFDPFNNPADAALQKSCDHAYAKLKDISASRASLDDVTTSPGASTMPRVSSKKQRGW